MKILNLYAGIGGNRKLWSSEHEITAVEINPEIAKIYKDFFPDDTVVVADAHQYLLDHFNEFDFIWSSPPCPTHSRARFWAWGNKKPVYPDMLLYQEIIFLKHYFTRLWTVENVVSFYKPLIEPIKLSRHYIWSNFFIESKDFPKDDIRRLSGTSFKDKLFRNAVSPQLGLYIFNCAFKIKQTRLIKDE